MRTLITSHRLGARVYQVAIYVGLIGLAVKTKAKFRSYRLGKSQARSSSAEFSESRPKSTDVRAYSSNETGQVLPLSWWYNGVTPNFGDWLSPFIVSRLHAGPVSWVNPASNKPNYHLVGLGSIGHFTQSTSVVVGTGVLNLRSPISSTAHFLSVRGPISSTILEQLGGPKVNRFGDPAVILPKLLSLETVSVGGKVAVVRHLSESMIPLTLPEDWEELSIAVSGELDLVDLIMRLRSYKYVVTSALHILIACQSFGIPCAVVRFSGDKGKVRRDEMKFLDYADGVGVRQVIPQFVSSALPQSHIASMVTNEQIPDSSVERVHEALLEGIDVTLRRLRR